MEAQPLGDALSRLQHEVAGERMGADAGFARVAPAGDEPRPLPCAECPIIDDCPIACDRKAARLLDAE